MRLPSIPSLLLSALLLTSVTACGPDSNSGNDTSTDTGAITPDPATGDKRGAAADSAAPQGVTGDLPKQ